MEEGYVRTASCSLVGSLPNCRPGLAPPTPGPAGLWWTPLAWVVSSYPQVGPCLPLAGLAFPHKFCPFKG